MDLRFDIVKNLINVNDKFKTSQNKVALKVSLSCIFDVNNFFPYNYSINKSFNSHNTLEQLHKFVMKLILFNYKEHKIKTIDDIWHF